MTLSQSELSFSFDAEGVILPGELPDYPEPPSIASSNAASSVALGTMPLFSMYSDGVWSLPPIGPRPSSEGTPAADEVLASEPPPVSASVRWHWRPRTDLGALGQRSQLWVWRPL